MEYEYISFLCHNLLNIHINFANAFHMFQKNHPKNESFEFYYDDELVSYMVMMLRRGKEFDFSEYNKLVNLFDYINDMEVLQDKEDALVKQKDYMKNIMKLKKYNYIRELDDYTLSDGHLIRFEVNQHKKECKFFFDSVTAFGDSRKIKVEEDADEANIIVTFKNVEDVQIHGIYEFEHLRDGRVYNERYNKISEQLYHFSLLCIANYEHFIIEFTFSDVSVEAFDYSLEYYGSLIK